MKLTYPICCGVDVHKTFLVATIITSEYVMPHYHQKRFSTFYNGLVAFKKWLLEYDCKDVCMESTGKYWVPIWNVLEDSCHVVIANPKWVSAVKGNKDDKKDSKWIGNLFRMDLVPSSYIPSKDIRILREFTRYRSKLVSMRSSEKNRFQNAFTVCNLTLDAVVSDMFGRSATDIENYLLDTDTVDPEHCVSLLHRSLKKKASDVVEAVSGFNMAPEQKERVRIVQGHFADIDHRIAQLDEIISNLVAEYEGQISLLPVTIRREKEIRQNIPSRRLLEACLGRSRSCCCEIYGETALLPHQVRAFDEAQRKETCHHRDRQNGPNCYLRHAVNRRIFQSERFEEVRYAGGSEKEANAFFRKRSNQAACFSWPCPCRFYFPGRISRLGLQLYYSGVSWDACFAAPFFHPGPPLTLNDVFTVPSHYY